MTVSPRVLEIEAEIIREEGHFHVAGRYYANGDDADRQRRWEAERRERSELPQLVLKRWRVVLKNIYRGNVQSTVETEAFDWNAAIETATIQESMLRHTWESDYACVSCDEIVEAVAV